MRLKAAEAIAYKHLQLLMPSKWLSSASQAKSKVKTNKQQQQLQLKSSCGSPLASISVPDLFARHAASDSLRVKGLQLAAT
ncbi:hypothetical protein WJX77_008954 [Trebouxia sp. C0004]